MPRPVMEATGRLFPALEGVEVESLIHVLASRASARASDDPKRQGYGDGSGEYPGDCVHGGIIPGERVQGNARKDAPQKADVSPLSPC